MNEMCQPDYNTFDKSALLKRLIEVEATLDETVSLLAESANALERMEWQPIEAMPDTISDRPYWVFGGVYKEPTETWATKDLLVNYTEDKPTHWTNQFRPSPPLPLEDRHENI